jgi:hypothetical protein
MEMSDGIAAMIPIHLHSAFGRSSSFRITKGEILKPVVMVLSFFAPVFTNAAAPAPALPNIECAIRVSPLTAPWADTVSGSTDLELDATKPSDFKQSDLTFRGQEFSVVIKAFRNQAGQYANYQVDIFDEHGPKYNDPKYYFDHVVASSNNDFSFDAGLKEFKSVGAPLKQSKGYLSVNCVGK